MGFRARSVPWTDHGMGGEDLVCTSFLGKMSFKPVTGATFLRRGQSVREVIQRRQPFREKLPWRGEPCFVFPLCCMHPNAVLLFFFFFCLAQPSVLVASQGGMLCYPGGGVSAGPSCWLWHRFPSAPLVSGVAPCCSSLVVATREPSQLAVTLGSVAAGCSEVLPARRPGSLLGGLLTGRAPYWEGSRGKSLRAGIKTACLAVLSPLWIMQTFDIFCIRFPFVVILSLYLALEGRKLFGTCHNRVNSLMQEINLKLKNKTSKTQWRYIKKN